VVVGYFDADWTGNADERKSTFGGCFYLGTNLVAWMSRKLLHSIVMDEETFV